MRVLKFGGTSVGAPERMHHVAQLVTQDEQPKIVVLSAVSGTTNALVQIGQHLAEGKQNEAKQVVEELTNKYAVFVEKLVATEECKQKAKEVITEHFDLLNKLTDKKDFHKNDEKIILAQGELLSTKLFSVYLQEAGIKAQLLPALEFMVIDEYGEPVVEIISQKLKSILAEYQDHNIFVTQGYICRNHKGEVDNLKRGGSDYSASLIGAAINSDEVQIWTDISGMHNNDPRIVKDTYPIARLSFDEAAELAYFGAKILHPSSILPAQKYEIPVRLLNTMEPEAEGTLISKEATHAGIRAIAAKDGITAVKIKSGRMLMAYGFLRQIFEIFEKYRTPIDMITTSEVAVSVTIDDNTHLESIIKELDKLGQVEIDENQAIVCLVGYMISERKGIVTKALESLHHIPLRMISFGGSKHNVSILIDAKYKVEALTSLNEKLFKERVDA